MVTSVLRAIHVHVGQLRNYVLFSRVMLLICFRVKGCNAVYVHTRGVEYKCDGACSVLRGKLIHRNLVVLVCTGAAASHHPLDG